MVPLTWGMWAGPPSLLPSALFGNGTTLSDTTTQRGANKHFRTSARELIMNRFMSNDSISAGLRCSRTPPLRPERGAGRSSKGSAGPAPHTARLPLQAARGGMTATQGLKRGSEPPANE